MTSGGDGVDGGGDGGGGRGSWNGRGRGRVLATKGRSRRFHGDGSVSGNGNGSGNVSVSPRAMLCAVYADDGDGVGSRYLHRQTRCPAMRCLSRTSRLGSRSGRVGVGSGFLWA